MQAGITEVSIVVVYVILVGILGTLFKKFNHDASDYFRGGARTSWWLLGSSLWISVVSAEVFTGVAGAQFEAGLAPMASNLAIIAACILMTSFLAAWFRQLRVITSAEVIRLRFGAVTEQVYSYFGLLTNPMWGGFQLFGLSMFVGTVFGIPMQPMIIGLAVTIGLYTLTGGRWAVMATDFLQSLILIPVTLLVAILALIRIGGPVEFFTQSRDAGLLQLVHPADAFDGGQYSFWWVVAVFVTQMVSQLQLNWSSRFFAAKDGREAKKAAGLLLFLFVFGLYGIITPMVSRLLFYDQVMEMGANLSKPAEAAYIVACRELLPAGLMGLVIVAMFSATSSSMDTGINSISGVVVRNILPALRRRFHRSELTPRGELAAGRWVSLAMLVYVTGIALYLSMQEGMGIFELILLFAVTVNLPITLPTFLALIFKKSPRCSALLSAGFGIVLPLVLIPILQHRDIEVVYQMRVFIIMASGMAGYFLSYAFRGMETEETRRHIHQFYVTMRTPVDFEKEIGHANDFQQMTLLGRLAIAVGVMMWGLLLVPNEPWARLAIFLLGASVSSVGLLLLFFAKRHPDSKRS